MQKQLSHHERKKLFKDAFTRVMESYIDFRFYRPVLRAANRSPDDPSGGTNPASPSPLEFCYDVEKQIEKILGRGNANTKKFFKHYMLEDEGEALTLTPEEQSLFESLEQNLGKMFVGHGMFPVSKYFKTVRQRRNR